MATTINRKKTAMPKRGPNLDEIFRKTLNSHGYGFQYRVIAETRRLFEQSLSHWAFRVSEFPVGVRGRDARIDLLLQLVETETYMVGECKRVNPGLSNWCFARAPYVRRNRSISKLFVQHAMINGNANLSVGISEENAEGVYHIPFEISSGQHGDAQGTGRGAIEKAAEQVLLGINGMVEFAGNNKLLVPLRQKRHYIPVIFTTAKLFTTELDLSSASLERGDFETGAVKLMERPWVWYNYHQSPTLKHSSRQGDNVYAVVDPARKAAPDYGDILETEYARSIAVVSPAGIQDFLGKQWFFSD